MRVLVLSLLLIGACGGGSSPTSTMVVKTSGAEVSTLGRYRTYSHATAENAPEGYVRGAVWPQVLEDARQDVDAELQRKGYQLADGGELVVRISSGRRTVEDQPTGRAAAVGAPATEETEGALVIDLLDRASGRQLFHGYARDVIAGDHVERSQISAAVTRILGPIPSSSR